MRPKNLKQIYPHITLHDYCAWSVNLTFSKYLTVRSVYLGVCLSLPAHPPCCFLQPLPSLNFTFRPLCLLLISPTLPKCFTPLSPVGQLTLSQAVTNWARKVATFLFRLKMVGIHL